MVAVMRPVVSVAALLPLVLLGLHQVALKAQGGCRPLPQARERGTLSLEETLTRRRSVRAFAPTPLSDETLAQLFWAAQGITDSQGHRTAPSAGALYPLELYAATERGLFHYDPKGHCVETVKAGDVRSALKEAALSQDAVGEAPAVFMIGAVYERTAGRYRDRTERYVPLEAGHAAQNLLLQATALDLGAVPMGAFNDAAVARVLGLPKSLRPLYLIPVGVPR
jgi:SagB-type dehydrogenase family enzyme